MNTPGALESHANAISILIKGCEHCVNQCELVLEIVSEQDFIRALDDSASIGTHMRHLLDRFQCLFNGLPEQVLDYDDRKRDKSIATNLEAANFAIASLRRRLQSLAQHAGQGGLELMVRETVHPDAPQLELSSNLERELMGLITHINHHLAIIAVIGKQMGYEFGSDFGKAPSTILYERG